MASTFDPSDTEISTALDYLRGLQQDDGSISDFGTSSWATMAIAAAGEDPNAWAPSGISIVDFLKSNTDQLDLGVASDVERFILPMTAARENPRDIDGIDYSAILEGHFNVNQIGDSGWLFDDFWGILALISAGTASNSTIIKESTQFVKDNQASGGWGWAVGVDSDVDDTAAALMALLAAGDPPDSNTVTNGLKYLKSEQCDDGGFPSFDVTNSASDSWAICALNMAGEDPTGRSWRKGGYTPVDHLLSLQNQDGSFNWTASDPDWVNRALMTSYALIALSGRSYPVNGETIYLRIEGDTETIWCDSVFVAGSLIHDSIGGVHYLRDATALGALDKAAELGGFNYEVQDTAMGLFVSSIAGEDAAGMEGWLYRVDYSMSWVGAADFVIGESTPPEPPHTELMWYYGVWTALPTKVEASSTTVKQGKKLEVTVSYYNDTLGDWLGLDSAWVVLGDSNYTTDSNGAVSISTSGVKPRTYNLWAGKQGFIRSDVVTVKINPKPKPPSPPPPPPNEKPVANFTWYPSHPTDLDIVNFTDGSYDSDGSIVEWFWNFGDGFNSTESNPIHKFAAGNYTISLKVTDDDGASKNIEAEITVLLGDTTPPITIDNYDDEWHVKDFFVNITATDDVSGVQTTHYQINDGPVKTVQIDGQPCNTLEGYTKLEYWSVDCACNEEDHKIIEIKLDKTVPVADAGGDQIVDEGTIVNFDASGSSDNMGIVSNEWKFEDGSTMTDLTVTRAYTEPGSYGVILTVQDAAGNEDEDSIFINVIRTSAMINIVVGSVSSNSTYIGNSETVWFKAVYDHDSNVFDGSKGILYIDDEPMEWSSENSRWEKEVVYKDPQIMLFEVTSVKDNQYSSTQLNDLVGPLLVEWKRKGIPGYVYPSIIVGIILVILLSWYFRRS